MPYGQSLLGGPLGFDIIVGTSAQVSAQQATHTVDDFVAAISADDRVLILSGTHALTRDEDITEDNVTVSMADSQAILQLGEYTLTFSGNGVNAKLRFTDVRGPAIYLSGSNCDFFFADVNFYDLVVADPITTTYTTTGSKQRGSNVVAEIEGYLLSSPFIRYIASTSVSDTGETAPREIVFSRDGDVMIMSASSSVLHQFSLTTPWDIRTMSYDSITYDFTGDGSGITAVLGLFVKPDGTKLYVAGAGGGNAIHQYTMATPWDITTLSYDSISVSVGVSGSGLVFSEDGAVMIAGAVNSQEQYTLSTPWDVSTAALYTTLITGSSPTNQASNELSRDGTKLFLFDFTSPRFSVWQYNMSTAFDLDTAVLELKYIPDEVVQDAGGIRFDPEGRFMYLCDYTADEVHMYEVFGIRPPGSGSLLGPV